MATAASMPLSKIRVAHGLVFLAGDMPFAADGSVPDGIDAQTDTVLGRIAATLATVGLGLNDVVQVGVQLVNGDDFAAFNIAYARHFTAPYPVRTTIVAGLVAKGALLEITVVAAERTAA